MPSSTTACTTAESAGLGARAHIHGRPGDGAGGGHAAEQAGGDGGQALARAARGPDCTRRWRFCPARPCRLPRGPRAAIRWRRGRRWRRRASPGRPAEARSMAGREGEGRECGSAPILGTSSRRSSAAAVASSTREQAGRQCPEILLEQDHYDGDTRHEREGQQDGGCRCPGRRLDGCRAACCGPACRPCRWPGEPAGGR